MDKKEKDELESWTYRQPMSQISNRLLNIIIHDLNPCDKSEDSATIRNLTNRMGNELRVFFNYTVGLIVLLDYYLAPSKA